MSKEITPEDIRQKHIVIESEIIEKALLDSIEIANNLISNRYDHVIECGYIKLYANSLEWPRPVSRWKVLAELFKEFYSSWDIEHDWTGGEYYIKFTPKQPIDASVKIDISKIKDEKKEIIPEKIKDRFDILDL